ncbi:MAG: hypothetical protein ABJ374_07650, partial [Nitratireductor sp.]
MINALKAKARSPKTAHTMTVSATDVLKFYSELLSARLADQLTALDHPARLGKKLDGAAQMG